MEGRFDDLRSICLKLVERYSNRRPPVNLSILAQLKSPTKNAVTPPSPARLLSDRNNPFHELFRPALQHAIVAWGFKKGFQRITDFYWATVQEKIKSGLKWDDGHYLNPTWETTRNFDAVDKRMRPVFFPNSSALPFAYLKLPSPDQSFVCGLLLLEELAKRGVCVQIAVIRKAVKDRLWQLYNLNESNIRANRATFVANPYRLEDMVWAIEQAWNGPTLFPELYKSQGNVESEAMMPPKVTKEETWTLSPQAYVATRRYENCRKFFCRKGKEEDFNALWAMTGTNECSSVSPSPDLFPQHDEEKSSKQASKNKLPPSGIAPRRPPPLLQGLVDIPRSSELRPLTSEERIEKRKSVHFALFGTQPMALGKNRRKRVNKQAWAKWVDCWARKYEYPEEPSMHEDAEVGYRPETERGEHSQEKWELLHAYRIAHDIPQQRREDNDSTTLEDWELVRPHLRTGSR
jgi:hypothetical protein